MMRAVTLQPLRLGSEGLFVLMLRHYLQVVTELFLCPFLPLSKISIPLLAANLTTD